MQQGNAGENVAGGRGAMATLTDEQILDMEPAPGDESGEGGERTGRAPVRAAGRAEASGDTAQAARRAESDAVSDWARRMIDGRGEGRGEGAAQRGVPTEKTNTASSSAPAAVDAAEKALRDETDAAASPDGSTDGEPESAASADVAGEPAWLAALEAQPAAAAEARRWQAAAKDVAALDAAYFNADAGARAGLAERLYASDPGAFREMLAASARTLAARDPEGLRGTCQATGSAGCGSTRDASQKCRADCAAGERRWPSCGRRGERERPCG